MNIHYNLRIFPITGIIFSILVSLSFAQDNIGDISDGNRSIPVHIIELYDEEGALILPSDRIPMPFSPKQTCLKCHDYEKISSGWHFNSIGSGVSSGRKSEPWILYDPISATQIPLSYRDWPGTYDPGSLGLSPFFFTEKFGRHLTGGGISENDSTESPDIYLRWQVSGKAEINCLSCHDNEAEHDQAQYEQQMIKQNYRWAAAATSNFTSVKGSAKIMPDNYDIYSGAIPDIKDAVPPSAEYDINKFDKDGKVFFDVVRNIRNDRCYFCHSSKNIGSGLPERWETDQDVHLTAGLTCVDCHRNGLDHSMTRGYEWEANEIKNSTAAAFSCSGCHIRDREDEIPESGRLGAPNPKHNGIPLIHFDKLSCTACHSGPWPTENTQRVKLSRTHGLGTYNVKKDDNASPYIYSPVYVKDEDGKISPHRMIWPSFWGYLDGDNVEPVPPVKVQKISLAFILSDSLTDSTNIELLQKGRWPVFSEKQIVQILDSLGIENENDSIPVYVNGGKLFSTSDTGKLTAIDHSSAEPYTWAFAHEVRPAEQSLGIRGCGDCHSLNSTFSFGTVAAELPFDFSESAELSMTSLQDLNAVYPRVFAVTFLFRPIIKYTIIICCMIIFMIMILFAFKALNSVLQNLPEKKD
ncbi:hypothetical protein ACFL7D_10170 [candidate division KSB1 bacterium]